MTNTHWHYSNTANVNPLLNDVNCVEIQIW